ncbi:MAG: hypothetical protein JRI23_27720 [Deltaproteobacteria bacterium]|jgi:hypothetical protein|nr:hypothetical protein [Deltaproteobacteria bacterium]MBW2535873.1 hypothetical protein [Deltaproteobacteria bacterium]
MISLFVRCARRIAWGGLAAWLALGCNNVLGVDEFGEEDPTSTGVGGGSGGSDADGGAGGGGVASYACSREILIETSVELPGYTAVIELDHAALIGAGKSSASGDDVRIFQSRPSGGEVELSRVASPRTPWGGDAVEVAFRLPELSAEDDATYLLVYGAASATAPPNDPGEVFDLWDDFDGPTLDPAWLADAVGADAAGAAEVVGGALVVTANGTGIDAAADSLFFVHRELSRDFVAETVVEGESGNAAAALVGGLMARAGASPSDPFVAISYRKENQGSAWLGWRTGQGEDADGQADPGAPSALPVYFQLRRSGPSVRGAVASGPGPFVEAGQGTSIGGDFPEPFRVGVPFANLEASSQTELRVGWFSARLVARPEPTITLGPEGCD